MRLHLRTLARRLAAPGVLAAALLGVPATAAAAGGTVYAETNGAAGNGVATFDRASDGTLTPVAAFATGGTGTGAGLGSQGAVTLTDGGGKLLAVNAGSDSVSVFGVDRRSLRLLDVEGSGGDMPISVTVHRRVVYVLNAGGAGGIAGFRLKGRALEPIPGSSQPLSSTAAGPAQVAFSPDGRTLVVTEKNTNAITTYAVGSDGVAGPPTTQASSGMTPFGFGFTSRGQLVVSEAFGGAPDASAVSSYALGIGGLLTAISPSVPTTETSACWIAITGNDRYAYAANTGSGTVTGYAVGRDGSLARLDADGVTGVTGAGTAPADMALSRGSGLLYVRTGSGMIDGFRVMPDGSLAPVGGVGGLPASAAGLAAR